MKRLIPRPWVAVTLLAASILAGSWLRLSFGQPPAAGGFSLPPQPAGANPANGSGYSTFNQLSVTTSGDVLAERVGVEDAETRKAMEAYRQTQDENEKVRIAKTLPELVGKQFDARQEVRERELKQLETQLRKLQELHQRRTKQRDQIVEERVRQLLRDADGLGWGSDDDRPASISLTAPSAGNFFDAFVPRAK